MPVDSIATVVMPHRENQLAISCKSPAKHQSLHHFVSKAPWNEAELIAAVRTFVLPKIEKADADPRVDYPRHRHSEERQAFGRAVARQYCGELGKQEVAVTLSVAIDHASLLIALRLYLPQDWANDKARCKKDWRAEGSHDPDQAADCTRSNRAGNR